MDSSLIVALVMVMLALTFAAAWWSMHRVYGALGRGLGRSVVGTRKSEPRIRTREHLETLHRNLVEPSLQDLLAPAWNDFADAIVEVGKSLRRTDSAATVFDRDGLLAAQIQRAGMLFVYPRAISAVPPFIAVIGLLGSSLALLWLPTPEAVAHSAGLLDVLTAALPDLRLAFVPLLTGAFLAVLLRMDVERMKARFERNHAALIHELDTRIRRVSSEELLANLLREQRALVALLRPPEESP